MRGTNAPGRDHVTVVEAQQRKRSVVERTSGTPFLNRVFICVSYSALVPDAFLVWK